MNLSIMHQFPLAEANGRSVSLKKGYWEKESASDAQQSTCEFRLLLRRQTLYPAELRAHSEGNADFRAFLDHSQKNPII